MLQHAIFTIPNYGEGYTTDDNARALIFTVLLEQLRNERRSTAESDTQIRPSAIWHFLSTPSIRRRADSETFSATIATGTKTQGSEDCHGRALWGLGTVLGRSKDQGLRGAAGRLFEFSLPAVMEFNSPRAWAYTLLGIQEYLDSYPGDRDAQKSTIRPRHAIA